MPVNRFFPLPISYRSRHVPSQFLCWRCLAARQLSTSPVLLGHRGGKKEEKRTVEINAAKTEDDDDALDFSTFQRAIDKATNHLKIQLSKLRAGGVDLEAIESLKVDLSTSGNGGDKASPKDGSNPGKKSKENVVRLRDIAQVIPKGRTVIVIVGEKDLLDPATTALRSSSLNLHPNPSPPGASSSPNDPTPLEIHIPIPPTTTASRQQACGTAARTGATVLNMLSQARGLQLKRLRSLRLAKKVGPDNLWDAKREVERMGKEAQGVVERLVREKKRGLEGGGEG